MLFDINIEAWNKIETFLQRDVNIIYICIYFDIYFYFLFLRHCTDFFSLIDYLLRSKANM